MNPAIETRDLRLVQAIVEQGGVTRAAKVLHLSQSAVSHQLANLEERLGVALFQRVRKRMVITAAGRRLATAAAEILPQLALTQAALLEEEQAAPRTLRISTQCYTCYHWLPGVLQKLTQAHPKLELQIVVEATRTPVEALLDDRLDVALCCFPVSDRRLTVTPLFDDEMVVLLPASHRLANRRSLSGRDLIDETIFFYEVPPEHDRILRRMLFADRGAGAQIRKVPLTEAIVELVRSGHGVSVLSRWSLDPYLGRGDLVIQRLGRRGVRRPWSIVHPRGSPLEKPIATLRELLRDSIADGGRLVERMS